MKSIALALIVALAFASTGCSFSRQSRQQRKYEKYVRKSSVARQKQRARFHTGKPQMPASPMPTEPVQSTATGPEAATSGETQ